MNFFKRLFGVKQAQVSTAPSVLAYVVCRQCGTFGEQAPSAPEQKAGLLRALAHSRDGRLEGRSCPDCGGHLFLLTPDEFLSEQNSRIPIVVDLRGESETRAEQDAKRDLGGEDEELAQKIVSLQRQRRTMDSPNEPGDHPSPRKEAEAKIREIGVYLGENGGSDRMLRVAYRVSALGGKIRQLEWCWEGICGWLP